MGSVEQVCGITLVMGGWLALAIQDSCLKASSQAGDGVRLNVEGLITRVGLVVTWELSVDVHSWGRMKELVPNTRMIVQITLFISSLKWASKIRKSMLPSNKHRAGSHGPCTR